MQLTIQSSIRLNNGVETIRATEDNDLYKLVKAHSIQLGRLTDVVESLQSQIKQLKETRLKKNKATAKKNKWRNSKKRKK